MRIDGRAVAQEILARAKERASRLPHAPLVRVYAPLQTPATVSYLKIKTRSAEAAGCRFEETPNPSFFKDADAGVVQLPLPEGLDAQTICNLIPLDKDADALSRASRERFEKGEEGALLPPVVGAIAEILSRADISVGGKKAVVIGNGFLVGEPVATWLVREGALVTTLLPETPDDERGAALSEADIIVSGAGVPRLITPQSIKKEVVLIDAGTSESGGAIVGDADPACADKCAVFTPVPGGVGPIAVAKLFENAVMLAERATNQ